MTEKTLGGECDGLRVRAGAEPAPVGSLRHSNLTPFLGNGARARKSPTGVWVRPGVAAAELTVDPQTKAACLDGGREGRREEGRGGQAPSAAYLRQQDRPALW